MPDDSKALRTHVRNWMDEHGYTFVHQNRFLAARVLKQRLFTEEWLLRSKSIYETDLRCDFAVHNPDQEELLLIECMWQATSGTTDQKFPYKVLNVRERFPDNSVVIMLVDGGGHEPGGIEWLKSQRDNRLIEVVTRSEFHGTMQAKGYA